MRLIMSMTRTIVSLLLGCILGSIIVLYMYGQLSEQMISENHELKSQISNLKHKIKVLEQDKDKLSNRTKKLVIKNIEIEITNNSEIKDFLKVEIKNRLQEDLKFLITLPLESVAETAEAIQRLINGRMYNIQEQKYTLELESIIIYSTLKVKVIVKKAKS